MSVRITERVTPEGQRFERTLRELAGLEVRIGFQRGKAREEDGTDICDVAAWNELGTSRSPARPFLRQSVENHLDEIAAFLESQKAALVQGADAERILNAVGTFQKGVIQREIIDGDFAPNAPSTIRRKGSSRPLIDTGRMRQSVSYVIRKKGDGAE